MSLAFGYNTRTLNDNWFEDRHQPVDSHRGRLAQHLKKSRAVEPEIAFIGERFDVLQRIARVPPRESYAMPNDGFCDRTKTSADFGNPADRKEVVRNPPEKPKFITTETVPEVCYEDRRPVYGNDRGFGSVLNRHEENHGQRNWNTATGDSFGYGVSSRRQERPATPSKSKHSGRSCTEASTRLEGLKVGRLCGEDHRDGKDPSADTYVQRAWLYGADPALKHIHMGGSRPLPSARDNALSLPLGEGDQKKHQKMVEDRKFMLHRTATQITQGRSPRYGISIFQDG